MFDAVAYDADQAGVVVQLALYRQVRRGEESDPEAFVLQDIPRNAGHDIATSPFIGGATATMSAYDLRCTISLAIQTTATDKIADTTSTDTMRLNHLDTIAPPNAAVADPRRRRGFMPKHHTRWLPAPPRGP